MQAPAHIRLIVHGARRIQGHMDWPELAAPDLPSVASLVAAADAQRPSGTTWLSGGEPTLRADLPLVIQALVQSGHTVGLDTDGLALVRPAVLDGLKAHGLSQLRLPLHSVLTAAHDWVEGQPGSARRARRTAAAAQTVGLPLEVSTLVTRSTVSQLVATVRAAHALGARRMYLRRPRHRGPAGRLFVTVSPRFGLAEPYLEAAAARGRELGLPVRLDGFPRCVVARVRSDALTADQESWVVPEALREALAGLLHDPVHPTACPRCPGLPVCSGAPADYLQRFGRLELDDPGLSSSERPVPRPPQFGTTPSPPPPRAGRSPATRLRFAVRQAVQSDLGGDPTAGMARNPVAPLRMTLSGTPREIKMEMVRLAQSGPAPLLLDAGTALRRPEAHSLLREVLRLGFTTITVRGDPSQLGRRSRRSLARLQGITRFEAELRLPAPTTKAEADPAEPVQATLASLRAIATATDADIGVILILPAAPTPEVLDAWSRVWDPDIWPAPPTVYFDGPPARDAWTRALVDGPAGLLGAVQSALETRAFAQ